MTPRNSHSVMSPLVVKPSVQCTIPLALLKDIHEQEHRAESNYTADDDRVSSSTRLDHANDAVNAWDRACVHAGSTGQVARIRRDCTY